VAAAEDAPLGMALAVEPEGGADQDGRTGGRPLVGRLALAGISLAELALMLAWLATPGRGVAAWCLTHALLVALAAIAVRRFAAGGGAGTEDRRLVLATAAWCLVLPIFGAAIACVVAWAPPPAAPTEDAGAFRSWPLPARWDDPGLKLAPPARQEAPEAVAGDLLLVDRAHDGRRLHALLRAARLPLRFQVPLARRALADTNDDVRLYAFSLIDRRRREHERAVQGARVVLDEASAPAAAARAHLRLAELAWEGVYHGLQEGAALREALATALEHVDQSLALGVDEPAAHALRGRILLRRGNPDAADAAFQRALELGHPAVKVLPFLAESAFQRRRYTAVHDHLARLQAMEDVAGPLLGSLRSVMEHWL